MKELGNFVFVSYTISRKKGQRYGKKTQRPAGAGTDAQDAILKNTGAPSAG